MKQFFSLAMAMMSIGMTSACGSDPESFAPGQWELQGWLENEGSDQRIQPMIHKAVIPESLRSASPREVAFSEFYHGSNPTDVVFKDGLISGHLDQQAIAPFPAHTQTISGWYRSDAFEMRIAMPRIAGIQSYQVVEGSLAQPAG